MKERYDRIIIGAGFYGMYAALHCGKKKERVLVLECGTAPASNCISICVCSSVSAALPVSRFPNQIPVNSSAAASITAFVLFVFLCTSVYGAGDPAWQSVSVSLMRVSSSFIPATIRTGMT